MPANVSTCLEAVCDNIYCRERIQLFNINEKEARRDAKRMGWFFTGKNAYCTKHHPHNSQI